jgi:hypothetical protein
MLSGGRSVMVLKSLILFGVTFFLSSPLAQAGEYMVTAKAKSGGTSADGERKSDTSQWQEIKLSAGEYFNPADSGVYSVNWDAQRGETDYNVEWADYKEPFPGLKLPTTLRFRTHCRSPKVPPLSNINVSGVAEATVTAKSIKIP